MAPSERPVIVGAGLAGCAAAIALARQGLRPLLLERRAAPSAASGAADGAPVPAPGPTRPRICGEFVSVEAAAVLQGLGVDVRALGAQATHRLRLGSGAERIEAELPFTAFGLTRQTLDAALQQRAVQCGVELRWGQRVSLSRADTEPRRAGPPPLRLSDGEPLQPTLLMLATGKTEMPGLARRPARPPEALVGLQTHLRLAPEQAAAIAGHVEVLLFDGGYGGLQPVEDGRVNLCLLVPRHRLGQGWPSLLRALRDECGLLDERLCGAQGCNGADTAADDGLVDAHSGPHPGADWQTIANVPYGHLHRSRADDPPGVWRLGDQAAVIPSFTGDGMAIALHTAAWAAEDLAAGRSAAQFHARLRRELRLQIGGALGLYRIGHSIAGRKTLLALVRRWPGLLGRIAALTRVSAGRSG